MARIEELEERVPDRPTLDQRLRRAEERLGELAEEFAKVQDVQENGHATRLRRLEQETGLLNETRYSQ